jgi:hypothetical protein
MFQRKLMVVLGLVALLVFTAGASQASLSRVEGMGLFVPGSIGAPVLTQFTDDYVNIYYYPSSVARQNNLVLAELGNDPSEAEDGFTPSDQSFTVIRNFPRFGVIAFQMKSSSLNNFTAAGVLNHEQLDAIWGKAFTKIDFAVRLDVTSSTFEETSTTGAVSTFNRVRGDGFSPFDPYPFGATFLESAILVGPPAIEINTWGITPAITIHMQNDNRFEGAVTYRKYSLDRSESVTGVQGEKWEDDGGASYAVVARAFINKGDKHVWVPSGMYINDDLSWRVTNVPAVGDVRSADETYKKYGVGIADNMRVNDNNLLLWGVSFFQSKHSFERTDTGVAAGDQSAFEEKSTMGPLVFAAIETDATKWLKVRIGANRSLLNERTVETTFGAPSTTQTDKTRGSEFNFGLGTGIKLNNLDIDMTLNQEFPFTGGNVLSGSEAAAFTRASATYHF